MTPTEQIDNAVTWLRCHREVIPTTPFQLTRTTTITDPALWLTTLETTAGQWERGEIGLRLAICYVLRPVQQLRDWLKGALKLTQRPACSLWTCLRRPHEPRHRPPPAAPLPRARPDPLPHPRHVAHLGSAGPTPHADRDLLQRPLECQQPDRANPNQLDKP